MQIKNKIPLGPYKVRKTTGRKRDIGYNYNKYTIT